MDLNHRHTDFQSVALPTELPALNYLSHNDLQETIILILAFTTLTTTAL